MTWFVKEDGYELFFNRDERKSRRRADLPTSQSNHDVQYLSPTDADAGGTWIAANQFGVTVCLLNHYQFEQIETYKRWTSRGEIVRRFASTSSLTDAEKLFDSLDLGDYRAFRMFIIDHRGDNRLCVWDGHSARIERDLKTPKSSSSVDAKHVKSVRKDLFANLNLVKSKKVDDYINYHASHFPSRSKESVCMHRDDASTVSLSHVSVSSEGIRFRYADGSPCQAILGSALAMAFVEPNDKNQLIENEREVARRIAL
ncbi:MAG: NRDE family protein [Arenicella sp.]|nr:NRDE family protein [Arenicella sp.]